jgi:ABC-type nitrate/sulfonate/bicarbonate transport system substrate-binding protein
MDSVGGLWRRLGVGLTLIAVTAALSIGIAACGGDDDDGGGGGGDGGGESAGPDRVKLAVTSFATLGDVPIVTAAVEAGEEFNVTASEDDVTRFDSHATAMQVLLSGGADVISGSFVSDLKLVEQGRDLKVFCQVQNATEENVVGTHDVDSYEQFMEDAVVTVDSPGGTADYFMNFYLFTEDAGFFVKDLPNVKILEDGDQRLSALQNGEADASVIAYNEVALLEEAIGAENVNIISNLAEDIGPTVVYIAFAAPTEWIEGNGDLAARYCAATIRQVGSVKEDFDAYYALLQDYMDPPPARKDAKELWDAAQEYTVWPEDPLITEEQFDANVEVAVAAGLLEGTVTYEDAIAVDVMEEARSLLEGN